MFAGFQRGDCHLLVQMVRRADIDQTDVGIGRRPFSNRSSHVSIPSGLELVQLRDVSAADGVHDRENRHVEEFADLQECIAVCAAHEFLADETDVDRIRHVMFPFHKNATERREV